MKRSMVIAMVFVTLIISSGQLFADMSGPGGDNIAKIQRVNRLMGRAMGMVTEAAPISSPMR